MFDGVGSPLTQTFGLGLFSPATNAQLDVIEAFYRERGADVFHEVSPLADPSILPLLGERGYRPIELTSVMHMRLTGVALARAHAPSPELRARVIDPSEAMLWAETSARGWGETPELRTFMLEFGSVGARAAGTVCFVAEWGGQPIAAAALGMHNGVAILAGASTDPAFRGRGAQAALLDTRLRYATEAGFDTAMMGALPGSASQRNGERQGFRISYTRIKWQLQRTAYVLSQ
jgi:GNAT superfamily N-acetyltransferase